MQESQDVLDQIRHHPLIFTGEKSLTSIRHFLDGYSFATQQYNVSDPDDALLIPREFHNWVAYRLHFYESTSGWCRMIYEKTDSEDEAIECFFELLAEYRNRKPHLVAKLIGCQKTYRTFKYRKENDRVILGKTKTMPYPDSISLITYTDDPGLFAYSDTNQEFPSQAFFPSLEDFEERMGVDRKMLTIIDSTWSEAAR